MPWFRANGKELSGLIGKDTAGSQLTPLAFLHNKWKVIVLINSYAFQILPTCPSLIVFSPDIVTLDRFISSMNSNMDYWHQ
jgi:hypothetical protein